MDTATTLFDFESWEAKLPDLVKKYGSGEPFPHIILDDFLPLDAARSAYEAFPSVADQGWIHYVHFNEKKHGLNKKDLLPAYIRDLIEELNSQRFLDWLSALTGIEELREDEMLEGGGLHQSLRGGFLNIHADFTVHPHKNNWRRRVNLLIYLNPTWKDEYRGFLELWSKDMKKCVHRIMPGFNKAVIFNTDADSFHGLPDPIKCPEDDSRKSLALYYFTEEEKPIKVSTNYQGRPQDGMKKALIFLDKKAVDVYTRMKGVLGINDDFISNLLNKFGKK